MARRRTPCMFVLAFVVWAHVAPTAVPQTPDDALAAAAQARVAPYRDTVQAIIDRSLEVGGAFPLLTELCTRAPHRLSGSPGAAAAVEWARQQMERAGLENERLVPVTVPHWERGSIEQLHIVAPAALREELTILALGGTEGTPPEGVSGEVIEVQSFDELFERAAEAEGKIVFFNRPMDARLPSTFEAYGGAVGQRANGAAEAAKVGAVAAIVRSVTTRLDDFPHTGGMRYQDGIPRIPTAAVSTLDAERLSTLIERAGPIELTLRLDARWRDDAPSFNVVGEIVGDERPEEIVLVGGHLDGWDVGQGAHDDGSGSMHALQAVRLIKQLGLSPRRTIRVCLFMNEENGLRGAAAYRAAFADELERHVFALESDRGGFTPRGFTTNAKPEARAIIEAVAGMYTAVGADKVIDGSGGADINGLATHGVVLAGYLPDGQRYFDLHHSERDTLDQVSPRELELGAGVIAGLIYVVADLEQTLPRNFDSDR